jgi:hypothetical protein
VIELVCLFHWIGVGKSDSSDESRRVLESAMTVSAILDRLESEVKRAQPQCPEDWSDSSHWALQGSMP